MLSDACTHPELGDKQKKNNTPLVPVHAYISIAINEDKYDYTNMYMNTCPHIHELC